MTVICLDDGEFAYARERAAKAWLELRRAERPDLAWTVTVGRREPQDHNEEASEA